MVIFTHGKGSKINQDRRPGLQPAVNTENFPATAATKPFPNVISRIPLDLVVMAKREETCNLGCTQPLYTIILACAVEKVTPVSRSKD